MAGLSERWKSARATAEKTLGKGFFQGDDLASLLAAVDTLDGKLRKEKDPKAQGKLKVELKAACQKAFNAANAFAAAAKLRRGDIAKQLQEAMDLLTNIGTITLTGYKNSLEIRG